MWKCVVHAMTSSHGHTMVQRCARTISWDVQTDAELRNTFREYTKIEVCHFFLCDEIEVAEVLHV